jgi:hypothetical protein
MPGPALTRPAVSTTRDADHGVVITDHMQADAHEQSDDQAPSESHDNFERLIARRRRHTPHGDPPNDNRWNQ